jgi:RNA polymerase sigma factor (sigma-70 family)
MGPSNAAEDWDRLVERALDRDQVAWRELVDRLKGVAWKVLYGYDLSTEDRKDAFASTFFRVYERLGTIREPQKLPGWVATIARNEANTIARKRSRLVPMDELPLRGVVEADHSEDLIDDELRRAMLAAFRRLPADMQVLLRLLTADPPIGYEEVGRLLDLPHGSIGPTRQRCLQRLRNSPELAAYLNGGRD